jgi:hypothetical protein
MRKTRLMEIAARHSTNKTVLVNTSMIDGVVYMLCEMAESDFGPDFFDLKLSEAIQCTQTGMQKKFSLEFLLNDFLHNHLFKDLRRVGKTQAAKELLELPRLTEQTYVDYFVKLTTLERHTFRTELEKACYQMPEILAGYTTETPFPVCQGVVNYFKKTQNPEGLSSVIQNLSAYIKWEVLK